MGLLAEQKGSVRLYRVKEERHAGLQQRKQGFILWSCKSQRHKQADALSTIWPAGCLGSSDYIGEKISCHGN